VESVIGRWLGPYVKDLFSYQQSLSVVGIDLKFAIIYLELHLIIKRYINLGMS